MDISLKQNSSIVADNIFQELSSKEFELVRAVNTQDLIYLVDLGVFENNCQIDLNFSINREGLTPLMLACSKQNARLVQLVLNTSNMKVNQPDKNGYTALHIATQYKSLEVVKLLRENKVYFTRANNGTTPLHIAVKGNAEQIVKYFIEEMQVDINEAKDKERGKATPLALAISRGHFSIAEFLINKGASMTSDIFYMSCKHPNIAFSQLILEKLREEGYDEETIKASIINGRFDNTQSTPLIRACMSGNLTMTQFLIEKLGAIPELANKNDENCLIVSVRMRQMPIVKYLCTKAVKPNGSLDIDYECSRNGLTAFARAVLQNDFDIADVLLKQGKAFKNFVSRREGKPISEVAARLKNQKAVAYLSGAQGGANQQAAPSQQQPLPQQQPEQQVQLKQVVQNDIQAAPKSNDKKQPIQQVAIKKELQQQQEEPKQVHHQEQPKEVEQQEEHKEAQKVESHSQQSSQEEQKRTVSSTSGEIIHPQPQNTPPTQNIEEDERNGVTEFPEAQPQKPQKESLASKQLQSVISQSNEMNIFKPPIGKPMQGALPLQKNNTEGLQLQSINSNPSQQVTISAQSPQGDSQIDGKSLKIDKGLSHKRMASLADQQSINNSLKDDLKKGALPGVKESLQMGHRRELSLGIGETRIEEENSSVQNEDTVNFGRPDSRSQLKQQVSSQNMKETMEKLKSLKQEYRQKYTYKNFTNNENPNPKKK